MACSVGKNSNSTASLRAKQLQLIFERFCQMEFTKKFILRKLPKLIKNTKKTCILRCEASEVIDVHYYRYMLQKPNVWQVKLTKSARTVNTNPFPNAFFRLN